MHEAPAAVSANARERTWYAVGSKCSRIFSYGKSESAPLREGDRTVQQQLPDYSALHLSKKSETVADDLSKHGLRDRINVQEEWEAHYGSKKFGVSKEKLQEAVQKSG